MLRPLLFLLWVPALAHAQALTVAVLDATQVSDSQVRGVQRATENAVKQLSSLTVGEGPAWKQGAPRECASDCAREVASSLPSAVVVLLELRGLDKSGSKVAVTVQLWLEGEKLGGQRVDVTAATVQDALKAPLEALLPAWGRKGFGGLRLQVEPGTLVKIDGRPATAQPGEVQAVPAGSHQVDVVFPEGHAVLQRLVVPEGGRVKVEAVSPEAAVSGSAPSRFTALRGVSYATFVAGAAVLAGGLIAGALGRGTAAGLASCQGDVRDCATLAEVQRLQAEARAYSDTGNVMLGVGGGLAGAGVVMFIIDVATN